MSEKVTIRSMNEGEERGVCALIARVFDEFVGGDFTAEGIRTHVVRQPRVRRLLEVGTGGLFLYLGLRLAMASRE